MTSVNSCAASKIRSAGATSYEEKLVTTDLPFASVVCSRLRLQKCEIQIWNFG